MNPQDKPAPTPRSALFTTRIIWAALLMGQLIFLAVAYLRGGLQINAPLGRVLGLIAVILVVAFIPIAYVMRGILYGPARAENRVPPERYTSANIMFLAMFEGPSFLGILTFLGTAQPWPALLASGIAILVQLINFPTGSAMGMDKL